MLPETWSIVVLLLVRALASPALHPRQTTLNNFVKSETTIALDGAIANIGGSGSELVPGAFPGMVVAAPSTYNPDYFYSWTRDSALTFKMLVDEVIMGNSSIEYLVMDYIRAQAILQTIDNPSGSLYPAGLGLGEPKFYTNESRFNGDWGRPQRDGPALRAITLMDYSSYLLSKNQSATVMNMTWPIIYNDLKYVGQYWNNTGYDLWEEVHGNSFFTMNNQHRALVQGAALALKLGQTCDACGQAPEILCFLSNNYWNATGGYLTADLNVNNVNRSGINTDIILGSIHVFDINATCDAADYQPCNSQVLATHKVLVDSFRTLYPINNGTKEGHAVAIGRYKEDTYYFGNPWYLCTLAAAEVLYDAVAQINKTGKLTVDNTSLAFFKDIYPSAKATSYTGSDMAAVLSNMTTYADGFVSIVQKYTPANGSLSEQFNNQTGVPLSAYDLTWSFASFVTMARRRAGIFPPSWGFSSGDPAPKTCSSSSYNSTGSYIPAIGAGAPTVDTSCASEVLFTVNATTQFGENIYLVGNTTLLGGAINNPDVVILPMNPGNYTSARHEWFIDIYLPANISVVYQYINQASNGSLLFSANHTVKVSPCGGPRVELNDAFPASM